MFGAKMNLTLIAAVISAAAGFAAAWSLQAHQITKMELDHAQQRIAVARATRATLERNQAQIATAQAASADRGIRNRVAADGARNAGNGLRVATTAAVRAVREDPAACSDAAATFGELFEASAGAYRELAETCDRHVSDIQTLTESWPK